MPGRQFTASSTNTKARTNRWRGGLQAWPSNTRELRLRGYESTMFSFGEECKISAELN